MNREFKPFKYNPCIGSISFQLHFLKVVGHLNTTHVSVQFCFCAVPVRVCYDLNTTHVSVQYNRITNNAELLKNLNTTHVSVQ